QPVVLAKFAPRLRQAHDHLRRKRILLCRPAEGDEGDVVPLLEQEFAHHATSESAPTRGRKNGSFTCSPAASKTTSTGRSSPSSDGARPRRPETMRTPSSSATTTIAYGVCSGKFLISG